jgi:hypothetical protein
LYSSFANHFVHASRYLIAFYVLFVLFPRVVLREGPGTPLERFFRNYIISVLFFVVLGFFLILLKIYELLTLFAVLAFIYLRYYREKHNINSWEDLWPRAMVWVYDFADGLVHPRRVLRGWLQRKSGELKVLLSERFGSRPAFLDTLLFLTVFVYSAHLRFYDTLRHAAPAMSDSYVVIAWIKYLDGKMLFRDGIYPQGFHLYLDFLHKFSALDPLYIVNYSGPLHGIMITLSIYFAVSRWTGRKAPGILAAVMYGVLGPYLTIGWMRQAAANSQEYAFIFVMPAFYFLSRYIKHGDRADFFAGSAAVFIAGLTHSLAYAFIGLGIGLLLFLAAVSGFRENINKIWKTCLAGTASMAVALLPVGIGLLMGKGFYESSAEFLLEKAYVAALPELMLTDYFALAGVAMLFVYQLVKWKKGNELFFARFIILLGTATFLLYYYGGLVSGSLVISTRARELWGLVSPVCMGAGWFAAGQLAAPLRRRAVELVLCFCFLGFIFFSIRPQPIIPYKMEYESGVEQYLRISSTLRRTEWMIVSQEEGYALVYSRGYHMMLGDFLKTYDPRAEKLEGCPPDIFIYHEKRVFRANREKSIYDQREKENQQLKEWLAIYEKTHDNLSLFYEDENLKIARIHQPVTREETFQKIWGQEQGSIRS